MEYNYFYDHLFDLLNESELLDLRDIRAVPNGYRVTVQDGTEFIVTVTKSDVSAAETA